MEKGEKGDKLEHNTSEVFRFLSGLYEYEWGTRAHVQERMREQFGLTRKRVRELHDAWATARQDARYKRTMRNQERRIRRERKKPVDESAPLAVATWLRKKPKGKP